MSKIYDFRKQINVIDTEIIQLIAERFDLVANIQVVKLKNGEPLWDQSRVDEIIARYVEAFGEEDGNNIAKAIIGPKESVD